MKRLYTISLARTSTDSPRTGTLYFTRFTALENHDWVLTGEESVSHLTTDEQIAHIDTLLSILCVPGSQEDDIGMTFDAQVNLPDTPRIAIGVTEDVKELHTLVLIGNGEIANASMNALDERRYIQKDFISIIERTFKDTRKANTPEDIYVVQAEMLRQTPVTTSKHKSTIKSKLKGIKIADDAVHIGNIG